MVDFEVNKKYFLCCHLFMTKLCLDMQIFLSYKSNFVNHWCIIHKSKEEDEKEEKNL